MQLLLAGIVIIIIALLLMLFSRSQSLQRFAVLEFLLILMACPYCLVCTRQKIMQSNSIFQPFLLI